MATDFNVHHKKEGHKQRIGYFIMNVRAENRWLASLDDQDFKYKIWDRQWSVS